MSSFGERFKNIRLSMGLTQDKLTDEFNEKYGYAFSKTTISQYENNKRMPEMNTIKKFAEYFSVSLDYLLCNDLAVVKEGTGFYIDKDERKKVELMEIILLIKSLGEDNLITYNNKYITKEQYKILKNGIDIIYGMIGNIED